MLTKRKSDDIGDDFVLLELDLPLRPKLAKTARDDEQTISIALNPIPSPDQVLLTITPPVQPIGALKHTPCDIVLVIDVSASMQTAVEPPDQAQGTADKGESTGLSILDLVKHSARVILEKLNEGDRLAIVTFSDRATIVQGLLPMTDGIKKATLGRIEDLTSECSTNLWAGIQDGLSVFRKAKDIGNVQGIFVLTDGEPNHMCPAQGYVKKLQPILQRMRKQGSEAPFISCFGFGYSLRSSLLRSIAEVGRGYYAFIPDAGMIGTVFVHAVANMFSVFATGADVEVVSSNPRAVINFPTYLASDAEDQIVDTRMFHLPSIQYGHTRNVIIQLDGATRLASLTACLRCRVPNRPDQNAEAECSLSTTSSVPKSVLDYHVSRNDLCNALASLSTLTFHGEHVALTEWGIPTKTPAFKAIAEKVASRINNLAQSDQHADLTDLRALLADLESPDLTNPHGGGQISLALQTRVASDDCPPYSQVPPRRSHQHGYYQRWGIHYIPSILHAHMREICTTFKDPGPLRYGVNSPLFVMMRDELDEAFDKLPAPKSSLADSRGSAKSSGSRKNISPVAMRQFNSAGSSCFEAACKVRMAAKNAFVAVENLRIGDCVWTQAGNRMVAGIVKMDVLCLETVVIDDLRITPWHPVIHEGQWTFPAEIADAETEVVENTSIYSLLLEPDSKSRSHTVEVGGTVCVTLGHGLTTESADARAHPFFGSYSRVSANLESLEKDGHGRRECAEMICEQQGSRSLACGFVGKHIRKL